MAPPADLSSRRGASAAGAAGTAWVGGFIALLAAASAQAQATPPPFPISAPGAAYQRVFMETSAESDDGNHEVEVFPAGPGDGEQVRSQSGTGSGHGRLWMIPGTVGYAIFPSGGGSVSSAPLPNDSGSRPFLILEDPVTASSPISPFRLVGLHSFDAQCSTFTCGFLDGSAGGGSGGPIESEGEAEFDVTAGTLAASAGAATPNYGRRYYDARPGGGPTYNHVVAAEATASIRDWVYVTGPGATATLVVSASIAGALDVPPVPVNAADWTTPVYGDVRLFDPCADATTTSDELLDPHGARTNALNVGLSIQAGYQQNGGNWFPTLSATEGLEVERGADLHWADEEGFPDCSDDFAEVTAIAVGTLASSRSAQLVVPTNQWARVSASASAEASCTGPFFCDLDVSAPAQISVTSPNGTLVAWHGIAGLTAVPEPGNGLAATLAASAFLARARRRPRQADA